MTLTEARAVAKKRNQEDGVKRWGTRKIGPKQHEVILKDKWTRFRRGHEGWDNCNWSKGN